MFEVAGAGEEEFVVDEAALPMGHSMHEGKKGEGASMDHSMHRGKKDGEPSGSSSN
jgi:hypothetical protein